MRKRIRETIEVRKKTAKRKKKEDRRRRVTYKIQEKETKKEHKIYKKIDGKHFHYI